MGILVVVTGGSAGIGRALLAAAPVGAHRVDVSRSGPPPEADEHVAADLADPGTWDRVTSRLATLVDRVDWDRAVLVHAAATLEPIGFAGEVDGAAYRRAVLLDAAAPQVLGEAFLRLTAGLGEDRSLVLLSSGAARATYPGWSAYGAGKAAVDQWARVVAAEQRRRGGARVLAVAPGVVDTDMQRRIRATDRRDFPDRPRFDELAATGGLAAVDDVAVRLWRLLDVAGDEPVVDLRSAHETGSASSSD